MKIVIFRHGEPVALPDKAIKASALDAWIDQYNSASISPHSRPSSEALAIASEAGILFSSDLPRSRDSAAILASNRCVAEMAFFFEAGLPYSDFNLIKAKPKTWAVIFRALWYLGYSNNSESIMAVKERAKKAALILMEQAAEHHTVVFVGHGVFNRFIATELRANGFTVTRKLSSQYWGFGIYERNAL